MKNLFMVIILLGSTVFAKEIQHHKKRSIASEEDEDSFYRPSKHSSKSYVGQKFDFRELSTKQKRAAIKLMQANDFEARIEAILVFDCGLNSSSLPGEARRILGISAKEDLNPEVRNIAKEAILGCQN